MDDLSGVDVPDELPDDELAGQTEFIAAALAASPNVRPSRPKSRNPWFLPRQRRNRSDRAETKADRIRPARSARSSANSACGPRSPSGVRLRCRRWCRERKGTEREMDVLGRRDLETQGPREVQGSRVRRRIGQRLVAA
jgi:hypothetical protein